jgi:hypothetical protein
MINKLKKILLLIIFFFNSEVFTNCQSNNYELEKYDKEFFKVFMENVKEIRLIKDKMISDSCQYIKITSNDTIFNLINKDLKFGLDRENKSLKNDTIVKDVKTAKGIAASIFNSRYTKKYTPFYIVVLIDNKYWYLMGKLYDKESPPIIILSRIDGRIIYLNR